MENFSPNWDSQKKNIVDKFDFDFEAQKRAKQKRAIIDRFDSSDSEKEKNNLIKKDLQIKVEKDQFKKYYTRNKYPNGVELRVNKEVGTVLKPFTLDGVTSIIQKYDGRNFVLADVEGVTLPFYASSKGTDGKVPGQFYPFYGFSKEGWVMKDGENADGEWVYNTEASPEMQKKIKQMADYLSKNISLPLAPSNWVKDQDEYFPFQVIKEDKELLTDINNALGLPKDFDTKGITPKLNHDKLSEIQNYLLRKK